MNMKTFRRLTAAVAALPLAFAFGLAALADGDLVLDNYDRSGLTDFAASGAKAVWNGGNAGKSATIENNALKLEYASKGWFGTGGPIDASSYKYLKIRIKGAKGGEGADFDLNYAVGETVKTTGKAFADLLTAPGKKIPAVTTEYQDILIDLEANGIDKGIQAVHLNFHDGVSGTIWIDEISFTNAAQAAGSAGATAAGGSDGADASAGSPGATAEPNPKTGDPTDIRLYIGLAAVSGTAAIWLTVRAVRRQHS